MKKLLAVLLTAGILTSPLYAAAPITKTIIKSNDSIQSTVDAWKLTDAGTIYYYQNLSSTPWQTRFFVNEWMDNSHADQVSFSCNGETSTLSQGSWTECEIAPYNGEAHFYISAENFNAGAEGVTEY